MQHSQLLMAMSKPAATAPGCKQSARAWLSSRLPAAVAPDRHLHRLEPGAAPLRPAAGHQRLGPEAALLCLHLQCAPVLMLLCAGPAASTLPAAPLCRSRPLACTRALATVLQGCLPANRPHAASWPVQSSGARTHTQAASQGPETMVPCGHLQDSHRWYVLCSRHTACGGLPAGQAAGPGQEGRSHSAAGTPDGPPQAVLPCQGRTVWHAAQPACMR